jgi:hypothetical protein
MNYRCTNAECGWEGGSEGVAGTWLSSKPQDISVRCIKCGSDAVVSNYTRVPPTEPGWYWYKNACGYISKEVVEVRDDGETLGVYNCGWDVPSTLSECDGEWSARLEPPE